MQGENKIIWITVGIAAIFLVGIFVLMIALSPKPLDNSEKLTRLVRDDSNFAGAKDAKVTIVVFEDLECPACALYHPEFKKIREDYKDKIKYVFRHFPLRSLHPNAQISAVASESAGVQGKFFEYTDYLYENQKEWSVLSGDALITKFIDYAKKVGVADLAKFEADVKSNFGLEKISKDEEDGTAIGVQGTPTVYLNGNVVTNPTAENLALLIDKELAK